MSTLVWVAIAKAKRPKPSQILERIAALENMFYLSMKGRAIQ
jgi:hypothetical protein